MSVETQGDTALSKLEEVEILLQKEFKEIQDLKEKIASNKEKFAKDEEEIKKSIQNLKSDTEDLKQKRDHVDRLKSSSRDARKMYGDMIPGDTTHQDVILLYQNYFKSSHHNMPKKLPNDDKYKVWGDCAATVQASFDNNRDRLVKMIIKRMKNALLEDHKDLDESTYDLHRAFELFLKEIEPAKLESIVKKVGGQDHKEEAELVKDILTELEPDDYLHFISNGKQRGRKLHNIA